MCVLHLCETTDFWCLDVILNYSQKFDFNEIYKKNEQIETKNLCEKMRSETVVCLN